MESWLGLYYPSTDIPVPARKLFFNENVRIIKDIFAPTLGIVSNLPDLNLDLSKSEYRATSPIHIEYLKNMKVRATLSMPIVSGNVVWGLIACHHYSGPKSISYSERLTFKFLTSFYASQIQINKSAEILDIIKKSSLVRGELINQIIDNSNIIEGLSKKQYTIQDLTECIGAAIVNDEEVIQIGKCPTQQQILDITKKIKQITNDSFYETNKVMTDFPMGESIKTIASGLMCTFISESKNQALLWFKPEVKETVYWAGKPQEKSSDENARISPRKSFEKWKEIQDGYALPWKPSEIAVVKELRSNIMNFVTEKYEEIKHTNEKLKEAYDELKTFSYSVSHDLKAPLRGIDGFANIIKEDYYDSLDEYGKSSIETIINSVEKMNTLIDDVLSYSGLDQKKIQFKKFEIYSIFQDEIDNLSLLYPNAKIVLDNSLPTVYGDPTLIVLLVRNLLENALKYSSKNENPIIKIGVEENQTFYVQDNGVGFNQKHSENIFKVFNRLHNNFDGSGVGLSIVKRIIDKHNGQIWAKSEINKGSTFYFNLKSNVYTTLNTF